MLVMGSKWWSFSVYAPVAGVWLAGNLLLVRSEGEAACYRLPTAEGA